MTDIEVNEYVRKLMQKYRLKDLQFKLTRNCYRPSEDMSKETVEMHLNTVVGSYLDGRI